MMLVKRTSSTACAAELYEDVRGNRPVEKWMEHNLTEKQFAALDAAILYVLEPKGMSLGGTKWLTALGDGLWEFRVRHSAAEIKAMYGNAGRDPSKISEKILLSPRSQQREIRLARKRLTEWKASQARKTKGAPR